MAGDGGVRWWLAEGGLKVRERERRERIRERESVCVGE